MMLILIIVLILISCSAQEKQFEETKARPPASIQAKTEQEPNEAETNEEVNLTKLWSNGLTSIRTGEPLIKEGGKHQLDVSLVSYGNNLVVDESGNVLSPQVAPLQGGEQLVYTEDYQNENNMREYARIFTIIAPVRDAILYHFEEITREEWLEVTAILTINGIKTTDAAEINGRSILSTEQVFDYVASGMAEGSPVMRYLEEAELELKCLAFQDFDFTNPEGKNHCIEQNIEIGAGIKLP